MSNAKAYPGVNYQMQSDPISPLEKRVSVCCNLGTRLATRRLKWIQKIMKIPYNIFYLVTVQAIVTTLSYIGYLERDFV